MRGLNMPFFFLDFAALPGLLCNRSSSDNNHSLTKVKWQCYNPSPCQEAAATHVSFPDLAASQWCLALATPATS